MKTNNGGQEKTLRETEEMQNIGEKKSKIL